jgi:hypothetical protein
MRRARLALALVPALAACGGGAPLLHGAHVLEEGRVSLGAGASGQVLTGGAASDLAAARGVPIGAARASVTTPAERTAYAKGALAVAGAAPGVAPWVSARLGLPESSELGLTYSGRSARLDVRHAFVRGPLALSVGAGASAIAPHGASHGSPALAGLGTDELRGAGLDVPVLVGWQSRAGILRVWAGPRGGHEWIGGAVKAELGAPDASPADVEAGAPWKADVTVRHLWAGGVAGFSVGLRHVHAALELDAAWHRISGSVGGIDVKTSGVALAPAGALIVNF